MFCGCAGNLRGSAMTVDVGMIVMGDCKGIALIIGVTIEKAKNDCLNIKI